MRRSVFVAALVFAAAPLAAQEQASATDPAGTPVIEAAAPAPAVQEEPRQPRLHVSTEQIDAQLRAEPREARSSEMNQRDFLYTVAAVALGVLIALLLID
jgi:hypothetical protein